MDAKVQFRKRNGRNNGGTNWASTTPDCGVTNRMRSLKRKKWVVFGSRNLVKNDKMKRLEIIVMD
jgi:hypothetical protein